MEARPWKDGRTVSYRYHPLGGKPIALGTDRAEAIRRVATMLGGPQAGTIEGLWDLYRQSRQWRDLGERTRADYEAYSAPLLRVFGPVPASQVTAPDVARYLRVERAEAPVRANREIALLGNLIALAIERGEATANPCRGGQVPRNRERPRTTAPSGAEIGALARFSEQVGGSYIVVAMAAEFAALVGSRQAELLPLHWPAWDESEVRLRRAKQRAGSERVERVMASPALADLRRRLQAVAHNQQLGAVFPNRHGNPYTSSGFAAMWQRLMRAALDKGVITRRFTFHDLRAHYVTQHKAQAGALPDLHASPTTTARVYERSRVSQRRAL
jgi:integrase